MTLLNPWGLLALLAIPAILALHFFRQQRRSRRIGGLHLWDFARIATPAGGRFEKLIGSLPLLFQLLAALLLALLLAGFDIPTKSSARHFAVVVDDSVSMQARVDGSVAAQRAVEGVTKWAREVDRFTLVAAGMRPAVMAGPGVTQREMVQALGDWRPASPLANLDEAVNIATKFGSENSRILLVTDDPDGAKHLAKSVTVWGVGRASVNAAIVFADRFFVEGEKERIVATVQAFGGPVGAVKLTAMQGEQTVGVQNLDLATTAPMAVEMEMPATPGDIRLILTPGDALTADDSVVLVPAPAKPVRLFVAEGMPQREAFIKAATATRDVLLAPDAAGADLVFDFNTSVGAAARRVYMFADSESTEGMRMAAGRDLVTAPDTPLTRNLTLEGVVWPFDGGAPADARMALRSEISYTSFPLLFAERTTSASVRYRVNLDLGRTNIFRHTAWPVLMMNMVEECRAALPGLARTNLRAGEDLRMNLELAPGGDERVTLWREGENKPLQQWDDGAPQVLTDLVPGSYVLRQGVKGDSPALGEFRVNLFSRGESDLSGLKEIRPDLRGLTSGEMERTERNMFLYYGLLLLLAACVILGWVYHDAGH